jgi:hypothetical protein
MMHPTLSAAVPLLLLPLLLLVLLLILFLLFVLRCVVLDYFEGDGLKVCYGTQDLSACATTACAGW